MNEIISVPLVVSIVVGLIVLGILLVLVKNINRYLDKMIFNYPSKSDRTKIIKKIVNVFLAVLVPIILIFILTLVKNCGEYVATNIQVEPEKLGKEIMYEKIPMEAFSAHSVKGSVDGGGFLFYDAGGDVLEREYYKVMLKDFEGRMLLYKLDATETFYYEYALGEEAFPHVLIKWHVLKNEIGEIEPYGLWASEQFSEVSNIISGRVLEVTIVVPEGTLKRAINMVIVD